MTNHRFVVYHTLNSADHHRCSPIFIMQVGADSVAADAAAAAAYYYCAAAPACPKSNGMVHVSGRVLFVRVERQRARRARKITSAYVDVVVFLPDLRQNPHGKNNHTGGNTLGERNGTNCVALLVCTVKSLTCMVRLCDYAWLPVPRIPAPTFAC